MNLADNSGAITDNAYTTESCAAGSDVTLCSEMLSTVTTRPSSSHLRVVLPEEARRSPLQQHAASLTSLWQHMLHSASTQSDYSQLLADLAACLGKACNVDGCVIILPNSTNTTAQIVCWLADAQPRFMQSLQVPSGLLEGWQFEGWQSGSVPIQIENVETAPSQSTTASGASKFLEIWQTIHSLWASSQAMSVLAAATQFQGSANGVISFMRSRPCNWTQSEIAGIQTVSHQVASTVEQLRLQQQLSKQVQYQSVVNQLTLAIHNASDLNVVLKHATDDTATVLQVKRGMLLRLKHWDSLFRNRVPTRLPKIRVNIACEWLSDASSPYPEPSGSVQAELIDTGGSSQSFWLSECTLCQQAFLHPDELILLAGTQQDQPLLGVGAPDRLGSGIAPTFTLESLPTLLLAPLESQGTVLGFLVFQQDQPRVWQPEELELVQLVSAQVSTAIIQTETLRQVQSLVEKRTAELRESLSVQAKLYDRTRYQLDQLRHLNQAKDEFLSTVSHELRTPLTSMTMAIRMLRQVGLDNERSTCYLDILEQQCAQETSLVNDLLGLQELESNQVAMNLQEIDLKALMQDLIRLFQQKWSAKGLTLKTKLPKRSLRLLSDRDSLHRILFELLTNAGKYSDPNGCVQLNVAEKKEPSGNQIVVTLNNTGQGITPDDLPLIFEKFKRSQGATQNAVQGTGLGLALVKSLVQHLNGDITASSWTTDDAHTYETCFTLTLPQLFIRTELP
ncbi:MAG: HAMP domain-containing histidine kinase [Stenomitos rutilans HA7619-LM2]|jgi:signal transduction histidine kinase|nr:HAMP domain-containing histidine kinase [Stenomitos rutilans HA7619-LM2]